MLIKNLYNLFCGSESQDGRSDCAPDVIEEKEHKVIIPEKFKDDIQKLQDYCGVELRSGLCIEIELSELLEILPREYRKGILMILLCDNDLCQFSGRCQIPSQNIRFCGIFRVKIRVNQLIPSQEKSGTLNGVSVRVVVLMFIVWLH